MIYDIYWQLDIYLDMKGKYFWMLLLVNVIEYQETIGYIDTAERLDVTLYHTLSHPCLIYTRIYTWTDGHFEARTTLYMGVWVASLDWQRVLWTIYLA